MHVRFHTSARAESTSLRDPLLVEKCSVASALSVVGDLSEGLILASLSSGRVSNPGTVEATGAAGGDEAGAPAHEHRLPARLWGDTGGGELLIDRVMREEEEEEVEANSCSSLTSLSLVGVYLFAESISLSFLTDPFLFTSGEVPTSTLPVSIWQLVGDDVR